MKKRLLSVLMAFVFSVMAFVINDFNTQAEEVAQDIEFSALLTEDALIGYLNTQTRGVYLAEGYSVINDAGAGKIGCGGITNAAVRCKVGVAVIVERKVSGSWTRVTSWTATKASAYTVSISKTLSVGSGYYYRVRCTHSASTDVSSSYTEGLWM